MENSERINEEKSKKWYDNKIIVGILIIVFFPVGLYALWKSNTISKGWKVGWSIIICLVIVSVLANDEENDVRVEVTEQKKFKSFKTDTTKKLNISFSQMLNGVEQDLGFRKVGETNYGLPRLGGFYILNTDTLLTSITGNRDNILNVSLSISGSLDKIETQLDEALLLKKYLKNLNIDIRESINWIKKTYSKLYNQRKVNSVGGNYETNIYGQKEIRLSLIGTIENPTLQINIQHKDYFSEN